MIETTEKPARESTKEEREAKITWTNERALAQEQFEKGRRGLP